MQITIDQDFEVVCSCGQTLEASERRGTITVEPCESCREKAYDFGFEKGGEE